MCTVCVYVWTKIVWCSVFRVCVVHVGLNRVCGEGELNRLCDCVW